MKSLWKKLTPRYPSLKRIESKARKLSLPGLDGVPLWDVLQFFIEEIQRSSLTIRARAIAFSLFLALFPAIIFFFSLLPYLPMSEIADQSRNLIQQVLPKGVLLDFINNTITDLLERKKPGALTFSFLFSLFFTSNGVLAMMAGFDKSYDDYKKRNALHTRLVALQITIILALLFVFSATLIVAGDSLIQLLLSYLNILNHFSGFLFNLLRYAIIILTFFYAISLIYYFGPARTEKFKIITTGSTLTTFLSILTSIGFSYWVQNFNQFNSLYGSIGTIMVLMIWFNLNALIILIGYEINVAIYRTKKIKQLQNLTTA